MTFFALLTKELRLRLRSERMVWIIIVYVVLMGLLGWLSISSTSSNAYQNMWSETGTVLYNLLSAVQIFLILFITPSFTATAVNGEKERQTFDLLLCSNLSALQLVGGKLLAGLSNAFLVIAASIPLFSLVFFFGGVSLQQALTALVIFASSAIIVATFGLFCSTIFRRPAISTAVAYMVILLWLTMPLIITTMSQQTQMAVSTISTTGVVRTQLTQAALLLIWNPFNALQLNLTSSTSVSTYWLGTGQIAPWLIYTVLDLLASVVFFVLSLKFIKPYPSDRWETG